MATDGQIIVAAARWSDEALYLKDFTNNRTFPVVVKFVKGQYGGFGVPSLPNPGLQSTALLLSTGNKHKILAQAVKIKEGRRVVGVGPKIEIPESYPGYFELLSEEGRGMKAIETVAELARKMPDTGFLVREPIRALMAKTDGQGVLCTNGLRTVLIGETLFPVTEAQLNGYKMRFLQCMDSKNEFVFLGYDQRGKFSILAKEDHISGVHTARNLLSKRMPLTVRLVHGPPPKGLKSSSHSVQELRLLAVIEEENVFALPLQKDISNVVSLPLAAALKLQTARNADLLKTMKEFNRLCEKGTSLVNEVADRAHVLDGKLSETKIGRAGATSRYSQIKTGYFLRRSASLDSPSVTSYTWMNTDNENREPNISGDDYDDIDQIYDYVRGFAPLPKNIKSPFAEPTHPTTEHAASAPLSNSNNDRFRPEPPPIETIPTKKQQFSNPKAEKRTRKEAAYNNPSSRHDKSGIPSLYVKNSNSQRGRVLRQKSSSPMKDQPPGKTGSPVVSVRYKSLNNLHQAMDMDGTLDSSHSGGRTSGDSGAGVKLPEKRSRRLSRPLSLTNLVWEICRPQEIQSSQLRKPSNPYKITPEHNHPTRIGTLYL
ncbi:uncharacterized protein LOC106666642 [Cimex lectularius]|uniref:CABIT domain-containing protein n=1 Tax=Cimex lectularius TaxID=79782 RepID=A0A8I6RMY3_CIMLE|nr:uncharacterized protein LOC106666642 [Cimex lectularius]